MKTHAVNYFLANKNSGMNVFIDIKNTFRLIKKFAKFYYSFILFIKPYVWGMNVVRCRSKRETHISYRNIINLKRIVLCIVEL